MMSTSVLLAALVLSPRCASAAEARTVQIGIVQGLHLSLVADAPYSPWSPRACVGSRAGCEARVLP